MNSVLRIDSTGHGGTSGPAPVRVSGGPVTAAPGDRASLSGLLTIPGPAQTAALQPALQVTRVIREFPGFTDGGRCGRGRCDPAVAGGDARADEELAFAAEAVNARQPAVGIAG